jgi:hypothetical protein
LLPSRDATIRTAVMGNTCIRNQLGIQ